MSYPLPPVPREHIELLGNCIGLLSDSQLIVVVSSLLVTGRVPEDDEERKTEHNTAINWIFRDRTPLRRQRPGHQYDVERSVADYIGLLYSYARIDWQYSLKAIAGVEASYARYLERTSYLATHE